MQFHYEITADDYVACQLLHWKLTLGRKRRERILTWFLFSFSLLGVGWIERALSWAPVLVSIVGAFCIVSGFAALFPGRYLRRAYSHAHLDGKRFVADVNGDGFELAEEFCNWRVQWSAVHLKGENERAFILCSYGTIFMFGKKYLTADQQEELRKLSGLVAAKV